MGFLLKKHFGQIIGSSSIFTIGSDIGILAPHSLQRHFILPSEKLIFGLLYIFINGSIILIHHLL